MATQLKSKPAKKMAKKSTKPTRSLASTKKWVYLFEEVKAAEKYAGSWEGVRSLLGGKGAR